MSGSNGHSNGNGARPTVVIGFAEAASAPEVAWSLVDAGYRVLAFARQGRASALRRSRYVSCHDVRPPEKSVSGTLADIAALLAQAGPAPVLFPLDDTAVWLCSRPQLSSGARLAGPVGTSADLALDKSLQVEAAARAGFNVPPTRRVRSTAELYAAVTRYPVILKAAECVVPVQDRLVGSRAWICGDRQELDRACAQWAERVPLLVQPFIEGVGEGVFGIATSEGVRAWSGHRRLRMMNPQGSGSSACVSAEVPEDVKAAAEAMVRQTGWRGLFMIELLRDTTGRVWFVELNGRPWGSMALARRQGLEYPAWQAALAVDAHETAFAERNNAHRAAGLVCRHLGRELLHVLFVLRGPKSHALHQWPSIWQALGGVAGIRPGDALYNWRRDDPAVFISDCYNTVHDQLFRSRG